MRILHLSSALTWRGGEQQIAYLIKGLQNKGVESFVFCAEKSALSKYCTQEKISFYSYKKRSSINPLPGKKISEIVKKKAINLIHIHDSHAHTYAYYASVLFGLNTPMILSRRVDFPIQKSFLSKAKYNHKNIKAIICVSKFIKSVIEPDIKKKEIISVAYSGIDFSKFDNVSKVNIRKKLRFHDDTILIGNIASIAPHKDHITFLKTAQELLKSNKKIKFVIVGGDGGEEKNVKQFIENNNLNNTIHLLGFRNDIPSLLKEFDIFLFTSKEEGLGTSLLDALASKTPVVATAAGGIPEIIIHEKTGMLAPVKDYKSLAKHTQDILNNEILKTKIKEGGLKKCKEFSVKNTIEKTYSIYSTVLANS